MMVVVDAVVYERAGDENGEGDAESLPQRLLPLLLVGL